MELVEGHESFLGALRSWCGVNPPRQFQVRSFVLFGVWTTVCDCAPGAFGGILCLLRIDWSLRWFDVCICTDASEKGFAFAVREGCRELASEVGRFSERTRFKRSSKSIRARSRALMAAAPEAVSECSSSEEGEVSLVWRESRADFTKVSLRLLNLSAWELVAYGGFFGYENIRILEARPSVYTVRCGENKYPLGRLLIISDNLALVLGSAKDAQTIVTPLSVT